MNRELFDDDSRLIEACIDRDLMAWAAFVKKYSNLIYTSIEIRLKYYRLTASREDIEDIKQDTLSFLWKGRKLETIKNRQNISYWLAIVSGNRALEYMREKRFAQPAKTVSIFETVNDKELLELIPSSNPAARDELTKDEISKKLEDTIESLFPKERLAIKLNLFYNKKYQEIAQIMNIPTGTVSSYIKRAKDKLKDALKDFI